MNTIKTLSTFLYRQNQGHEVKLMKTKIALQSAPRCYSISHGVRLQVDESTERRIRIAMIQSKEKGVNLTLMI